MRVSYKKVSLKSYYKVDQELSENVTVIKKWGGRHSFKIFIDKIPSITYARYFIVSLTRS